MTQNNHIRFTEWKQPHIVHNIPTQWNWVVAYPEHLKLGKNTDIGAFTYINAKYGVTIEDDVQIGGGCHIYSENTINNTRGPIVIKKGACIGAHCILLPNTTIEENELVKCLTVRK